MTEQITHEKFVRKQKKLNSVDEGYLKKRAEEEGVARKLEKLIKEAMSD